MTNQISPERNKSSWSDLAIKGGRPQFSEPLRVGRPNVGNREAFLRRLEQSLDSRQLTNDGPFARELEARICDFLGVENCITVCNATVGLEIAIKALGLEGEVIVPSFTFAATPQSLKWQRITPVFADVDSTLHSLDPASAEQAITPHTTGIIGVHLWGRGCDTEALAEVAARHSLGLMYDAAHAFGCGHAGEMIGNFGLAEVFSFHATKFLNTFEGGAIVTNDAQVAAKARAMRNFGITGPDEISMIGTNGKMSEVAAAMGLTSLEAFDSFVAVNRRNHDLYRVGLRDAGLEPFIYEPNEPSNFQYVPVEVPAGGLTRDELMKVLEAENVLTRRYFYPGCHRMAPFRDQAHGSLPITEKLTASVLCFPTGTAVDEDAVEAISAVVKLAMENAAEIRKVLPPSEPAGHEPTQ